MFILNIPSWNHETSEAQRGRQPRRSEEVEIIFKIPLGEPSVTAWMGWGEKNLICDGKPTRLLTTYNDAVSFSWCRHTLAVKLGASLLQIFNVKNIQTEASWMQLERQDLSLREGPGLGTQPGQGCLHLSSESGSDLQVQAERKESVSMVNFRNLRRGRKTLQRIQVV